MNRFPMPLVLVGAICASLSGCVAWIDASNPKVHTCARSADAAGESYGWEVRPGSTARRIGDTQLVLSVSHEPIYFRGGVSLPSEFIVAVKTYRLRGKAGSKRQSASKPPSDDVKSVILRPATIRVFRKDKISRVTNNPPQHYAFSKPLHKGRCEAPHPDEIRLDQCSGARLSIDPAWSWFWNRRITVDIGEIEINDEVFKVPSHDFCYVPVRFGVNHFRG